MSQLDPVSMTTYKSVNGDPIGEFSWVTDMEFFEDDDEPVEVIEEVWRRVSTRTFWHLPFRLYDCDVDWCDENATGWFEQAPGDWSQRCEAHRVSVDETEPAS